MKNFLCVTLIAIFLVSIGTAIDCNNNRCGKEHTLCLYPNPQPAAACGKVLSMGLTQQEKMEIISLHNMLRQYVAAGKEKRGNPGPQPPAANMQNVTWDNELAAVAQRWANQCHFGHDKCRDLDKYLVGENVGIRMISGGQNISKPSDIITLWYDEVKNMDRNTIKKYKFVPAVGHYTQLVWAGTENVGCGKIAYLNGLWSNYYLVCNYGPAGNVIGQPIYQIKP